MFNLSPRTGSVLGLLASIWLPMLLVRVIFSQYDYGLMSLGFTYLIGLSVGTLVTSLIYIFHFRSRPLLQESEISNDQNSHTWPTRFFRANIIVFALLALLFLAVGSWRDWGALIAEGLLVMGFLVGMICIVVTLLLWTLRSDEPTKEWIARVVLPLFAVLTLVITASIAVSGYY